MRGIPIPYSSNIPIISINIDQNSHADPKGPQTWINSSLQRLATYKYRTPSLLKVVYWKLQKDISKICRGLPNTPPPAERWRGCTQRLRGEPGWGRAGAPHPPITHPFNPASQQSSAGGAGVPTGSNQQPRAPSQSPLPNALPLPTTQWVVATSLSP